MFERDDCPRHQRRRGPPRGEGNVVVNPCDCQPFNSCRRRQPDRCRPGPSRGPAATSPAAAKSPAISGACPSPTSTTKWPPACDQSRAGRGNQRDRRQAVGATIERKSRLEAGHFRHQPVDRAPPRYRADWTPPDRTARRAGSAQPGCAPVAGEQRARGPRRPAPRHWPAPPRVRRARHRGRRRCACGKLPQQRQQQATRAEAEIEDAPGARAIGQQLRAPPRSRSRCRAAAPARPARP